MRARDVVGRPVRLAVGPDGVERADERAVGIAARGQMWPLSMMGVHVDEGTARPCRRRGRAAAGRARRPAGAMRSIVAVVDDDVGGDQAVGVAAALAQLVDEHGRARVRVGEDEARSRRESRRSRLATLNSPA